MSDIFLLTPPPPPYLTNNFREATPYVMDQPGDHAPV